MLVIGHKSNVKEMQILAFEHKLSASNHLQKHDMFVDSKCVKKKLKFQSHIIKT